MSSDALAALSFSSFRTGRSLTDNEESAFDGFPGRELNWFVHGNAAARSGRNSDGGSVWCYIHILPRCLHQQVKNGLRYTEVQNGPWRFDALPATPRRTATSLLSLFV
jgi:hypothetical protein